MAPLPNEIYLIKYEYGKSDYERPCLIVDEVVSEKACILFISSAIDLFDPLRHYLLEDDEPDFLQTGLECTSFIDCERFIPVPVEDLLKKIGQLEGELEQNFRAWLE